MQFSKDALYSLFISAFFCANVFAQTRQTMEIDSLLVQGKIRSTVRSFYVKPIFEQYHSLVSVEGDGFLAPHGDLVRKRGFGIRVGYRWGRYEVETGLSTIQPMAGYRYILNYPGFGYSTRTRSTDFQQIPFVFRYRLWQATRRLSLRIGAGVAYNVDLNKISLVSQVSGQEGTRDVNGKEIVLARYVSRYDQEKSFISGEVNASAHYQFSRRFSASFEFKRLFSKTGVVRMMATQETFNPPAIKNVVSKGGANSYNVNIGVAYQFGFRNRYDFE